MRRARPLEEARARLARGDAAGAAKRLDAWLAHDPRHAEALNLRGVAALQLRDGRRAVEWLRRAVVAAPRGIGYAENLVEALLRTGRADEARELADALHARAPGRARPLALLGRAELECGEPARAVPRLEAAFALGEHGDDVLLALAVALARLGRGEDAIAACDAALARGTRTAAAWLDRGMALKGLGRLAEADAAFVRAGDSPLARYNRGLLALAAGELDAGFAALEARLEVTGLGRDLAMPAWDGRPLERGTLLVLAEQGLGDTLLASRCFAAAVARAARVVVVVPAPLVRLFEQSFPQLTFVDRLDGVNADAWVGALSLPHRLGRPAWAAAPWLRPAHAASSRTRPRIGLNWAGNPRYAYDAVRSTSLATFAPLLALQDVEWVSLHRGVREHEAEAAGLPCALADARDFLDTAHVLADLDLVVSTETAVPNLAGAMGVPTAVLTTPDVDWRWRHWYPSVTPCPQDRPGEWPGALARALEVMAARMSARAA